MSRAEPKHTNRLAAETSPYLLQHAHNPVDWFPWGPEALEKARVEERPIFLSIGYAACHWCHVMERESFENEATAALLNDSFVAIKVDREERPDLDAIYMDAVQQMTGHGGWPMSVFLTPDGMPFYGGTYFPDQPRHGLPSFGDVLAGVAEAWREKRGEVEHAGATIAASIAAHSSGPSSSPAAGQPEAWMLDSALVALEGDFDARNGGWGRAPKFPQPMTIEFLLRQHDRTGNERALAMARRSLDAMAAGGIYDHLGGGFARYATDPIWLVPHFEKMLYDNAQLARVYAHAWQVTNDPRYAEVVEETLEFVLRELLTDGGGFASSLDADTHVEEGATYVWSLEEIRSVLGGDAAAAFERAYGVTEGGNWEGHNILSRVVVEPNTVPAIRRARQKLFAARQRRPQPGRDDKVLTAWNGLMIAAFAEAGAAMDRPDWTGAAERAADLLLREARDANGRLRRSWKDGRALQSGVLEDYTHLCEGLLALYAATLDERWFVAARDLAEQVLAHFGDPSGGFFDTADDHESLITRPKGIQDNAVPSGNAMAATVLLKLAALTGEGRYTEAAERAIATVNAYAHRYPTGFGQWLTAMSFMLSDVTEIAIVGDLEADATRALLNVVRTKYRPFSVVALAAGARQANQSAIPLLHDRTARDGHATAYVCRAFACRAPVTEPADLAAQLASSA